MKLVESYHIVSWVNRYIPTHWAFHFRTVAIRTTTKCNKRLPDSNFSVSEKTEHGFIFTHWTFHFGSVVKCARSTVKSFCRNVATGTFFPMSLRFWSVPHTKLLKGYRRLVLFFSLLELNSFGPSHSLYGISIHYMGSFNSLLKILFLRHTS